MGLLRQKSSETSVRLSDRAAERRAARVSPDYRVIPDLPVNSADIQAVRAAGAEIRVVSRWLNAVSVTCDDVVLAQIRVLPNVSDIRPVSTFSRPFPEQPSTPPAWRPGKVSALNYGESYTQVAMLGIDSLHSAGLSGRGVLIGIIDTGFDTTHASFARLRAERRILSTYDFINGDSDVMDLFDNQRFHGTAVLSAMGGFVEGTLIGTAYGADFVLAKTEIVSDEIRAEEDYWVAGAEWMESLGVDIINSSVGYIDWYDTTQLDGETAVVTRAADVAASLGVVMVNCAGNEGNNIRWRKVNPPADGDSVIAVGAVDANRAIVDFSSRGPTADGRIKPDFCAMGLSDYLANSDGGYGYYSGTSFSSPLLAGGIAVLLEGHPDWNLARVVSYLKRSSSRATQPNNSYGWGIPNFVNAFYMQPYTPEGGESVSIIPHPAIDSAVIYLEIGQPGTAVLSVHDVSGAEVAEWTFEVDRPSTVIRVWDGRNSSGKRVASGIYICNLKTDEGSVREKLFFISN